MLETPIDLIVKAHGERSPKVECLDHGFVRLVDCMPRITYDDTVDTCDHAAPQAARVSYGLGTTKVSRDTSLIRYLIRHRHTSPTEMIEFKFHCKMPLFVARQWIRHRTANVNEMSGRYSVLPGEFYIPDKEDVGLQSTTNKQGTEGEVEDRIAEEFREDLKQHCDDSYALYTDSLNQGISRELARMVLPVNIYTEWYWKIDMHNLLHFLGLRCDEHAQKQIRVFADGILELIKPLVPATIGAWDDYHPYRGGELFSRQEVAAIEKIITNQDFCNPDIEDEVEIKEWLTKCKRLGLM
jgi:thymidylate synthase (FAD)